MADNTGTKTQRQLSLYYNIYKMYW